MFDYYSPLYYSNELTHNGVKGMKLGIRNKKASKSSLKQKKSNNENIKREISSKNVKKSFKNWCCNRNRSRSWCIGISESYSFVSSNVGKCHNECASSDAKFNK